MKGINILKMNEATIIEAVQLLLTTEMHEGLAPKVSGVTWNSTSQTFDVMIQNEYGP